MLHFTNRELGSFGSDFIAEKQVSGQNQCEKPWPKLKVDSPCG